jgi:hypothetical protein
MLRQSLLWPLNQAFTNAQIRTAPSAWNGEKVTCLLISFGRAPKTSEPGRLWQEEEFCVDPKSGLLQTYSVVPGSYNVYNYASAIQFHGRVVPRQFSAVVSGTPVLQAQVEIGDLGQVDQTMFQPPEGWTGPAIVIRGPQRLGLHADANKDGTGPTGIVVVHTLLSTEGKVLESEALQNSDGGLAEKALQAVNAQQFGQARGPFQRELFIRVEF